MYKLHVALINVYVREEPYPKSVWRPITINQFNDLIEDNIRVPCTGLDGLFHHSTPRGDLATTVFGTISGTGITGLCAHATRKLGGASVASLLFLSSSLLPSILNFKAIKLFALITPITFLTNTFQIKVCWWFYGSFQVWLIYLKVVRREIRSTNMENCTFSNWKHL